MVFFRFVPSVAMAVIFTVFPFPAFVVLTIPEEDTEAKVGLLLIHFNFRFAPFVALTFAVSLIAFPALIGRTLESMIFFTCPFLILILKEARMPLPSVVEAVIITVFPPAFFFKETTPFLLTVAALGLLDVQRNGKRAEG